MANTKHQHHLSELIESMKNDALEQAKKDTEKRRRKARREYRKTQRFIEKENLRRLTRRLTRILINCLSRRKRQRPKDGKGRSRAPRTGSANAESRLRSTHGRRQGRQRHGEARLRRRKRNGGMRFWTGKSKPRSGRRNHKG
jgi:hypothetical protein